MLGALVRVVRWPIRDRPGLATFRAWSLETLARDRWGDRAVGSSRVHPHASGSAADQKLLLTLYAHQAQASMVFPKR